MCNSCVQITINISCIHLALNIAENLKQLASKVSTVVGCCSSLVVMQQVTPGDVASVQALQNAMGITVTTENLVNTPLHSNKT